MIEGQEGVTWDDWVRLARLTEEHGLEGLFRSDHYTTIVRSDADALDAWTTLAGIAAVTERIRLGTLVSPATFRHPSVLARMAVTVDHISRGRLDVGMGAGWYEREHLAQGFAFHDARQRFELFAEQVEVVVRSWTEEGFSHSGPAYELREQNALPKPIQTPHPPLVLGGRVRPRFAALAVRYANEVNTLGAPNVELRQRRERLDRACEEAGRDPATLGFSLMTSCFVGSDRSEVLARVRRHLAVGDKKQGTVSLRGQSPGQSPEAVLAERRDRWLAGTVEEVAERIQELSDVGITRVFLQHLNHSDDEMVALVGERLLPALA
jgi:F420-dependent oxidoreductase-like protein